jgi:hypothetical protein
LFYSALPTPSWRGLRADSEEKSEPAGMLDLSRPIREVAVLLATTRPDEGEGFAAFVVEEVGVDRSGEARIVELDREIVATLAGALRPGGAYLSFMRCTA